MVTPGSRFTLINMVIALITVLVLADEPTASLDSERASQVVQLFADPVVLAAAFVGAESGTATPVKKMEYGFEDGNG